MSFNNQGPLSLNVEDAPDDSGVLRKQFPMFPAKRRCNDIFWACLFLVMFVIALTAGLYAFFTFDFVYDEGAYEHEHGSKPKLGFQQMLWISMGIGFFVSGWVGTCFAFLTRLCPFTMIYIAATLLPLLMVGMAFYNWVLYDKYGDSDPIRGIIWCLVFALFIPLWVYCRRRWIPLSAQVLKTVGDCLTDHPSMFFVSLTSPLLSLGFTFMFMFCLRWATQNNVQYLAFAMTFGLCWAIGVFYTQNHTTFAGIFCRWYASTESNVLWRKSLGVTFGTSFGSICFGAFLVAVLRTLESTARSSSRNAMASGNVSSMVCSLCCAACLGIFGDLLAYLNDWAFVQCALRGTSFCEGARVSFEIFSQSNLGFLRTSLLVDLVVNLGVLLSWLLGTLASVLFIVLANPGTNLSQLTQLALSFWFPLSAGMWGSLLSGPAIVSVVSSGSKSIITCIAEFSGPLREKNLDLYTMIEQTRSEIAGPAPVVQDGLLAAPVANGAQNVLLAEPRFE